MPLNADSFTQEETMRPEQTGISRRDFIKTTTLAAGGALLMSTAPPSEEASGASSDDLLKNVCDIHIHAAPDSRPRSINELAFAREAHKAGYRAVMYKSNDWSCHDRAFLIREALPGFEVFGSIIMNRLLGERVNPYAAEQALKTTGNLCRCIWMPTLDAAYQCAQEKRGKGIPVLDASGRVLPEVVRVMEICAEADIIFATGHSSPAESLTLARKAREIGVGKFVATHVNSLIWTMTPDQITQITNLGGFVELCVLPCFWGPGTAMPQFPAMSEAAFADFARIAPERTFISTDMGQAGLPSPLEGMRAIIRSLLKAGLSRAQVDTMTKTNPARLMGLRA